MIFLLRHPVCHEINAILFKEYKCDILSSGFKWLIYSVFEYFGVVFDIITTIKSIHSFSQVRNFGIKEKN